MNTREKILNAFEKLIIDKNGKVPSNIEIANSAGVAKGAMYYYFKDKDSLIDAVVLNNVSQMTNNCTKILSNPQLDSLQKLSALFTFYLQTLSTNAFLHSATNNTFHQKVLKSYIVHLTPILTEIIEDGCNHNVFNCKYPSLIAEFLLSELLITLDQSLIRFTQEELKQKMMGLAYIMSKILETPPNSFDFLFTNLSQLPG